MSHIIQTATADDIPDITDHIASLCEHHGDTYVADVDFLTDVFHLADSRITVFLGETDGRSTSFALVHPWGGFITTRGGQISICFTFTPNFAGADMVAK